MELRLDDSLTGRRAAVRPDDGRAVRLYVCGPTVYDAAHVGHARTYLYFDVVRRFLEAEGRPVRHVMNITDVEDKIDDRAGALGTTPRALARREELAFLRNFDQLGIRRPDATPRASDYVPAMVAVGRALERTGRVRRTGDEWYYEPPERPAGANFLSGADLASHAVDEPDHPFRPERGDGRSFMIWKRQGPPRPSWKSPWGRGVPGWHLECFAMAERLLGVPVDLHGGARDLVYPHHYAENEVALELEGRPFSHVYLHCGFVLQDGAKMSKSVGNLVALRTALAAVGPSALRWYLLDRPPAARLDWDARDLHRASAEHEGIRRAVARWASPGGDGRGTARRAADLAEGVRRDLAGGLRTDRAFDRIRAFARAIDREPTGKVARGEWPAARRALRTVEARTGISFL